MKAPLTTHDSCGDAHALTQPCYVCTENVGVEAVTLPGRQDEAMDVAPPAPQGVYHHADVASQIPMSNKQSV